MKNIIIDTDPGVDDALAIAFACFAKLDIVAITTVYGNSNIKNTSRNALTILELLQKKIPVFSGAGRPLKGKVVKASSHGENGLGGYSKTLSTRTKRKKAFDWLMQSLEKSENNSITIICMGPSTNIARLAIKRPDLAKKIKQLIILGGVFNAKGNISPYAEFNVINDPHALQSVLKIECKKVLIPINVCRKITFIKNDFNKIKDKKIKKIFKRISDIFIKYYTSDDEYGGFKGGVMYDLLTIAYLIKPRLFKAKARYVHVETDKNRETFGKTEFVDSISPNCLVAEDVDEIKLKKLFFKTMNS